MVLLSWQEQVEWATDEGMDFMVGETFFDYGEALLALECIKQYGKGNKTFIFSNFLVYNIVNQSNNL